MDSFKAFLESTLTPSPLVFAVGIAVVLLVPILLHFLLASTTQTSLPTVVLVGPSGAGKTALLTLYERGPLKSSTPSTAAKTHTSQVPASVELAVSEDATSSFRDDLDSSGSTAKKFLLIDTPGHAKLRGHALARLSPTAKASSTTTAAISESEGKLKAVVFVVDAAALADGDALPATAEYLYEILLALQKRSGSSKTSRMAGAPPVLIAANKQDLFTALSASLVKNRLELELGRIRTTKSKGLLDSGVGVDDIAEGEASDDWLGEYGSEKFTFKQMMEFDIEVEVIGGNVAGESGPGVEAWWKWIAERI